MKLSDFYLIARKVMQAGRSGNRLEIGTMILTTVAFSCIDLKAKTNSKSFSNTQVLGQFNENISRRHPVYVSLADLDSAKFSSPPENESEMMANEVRMLLTYQKSRSSKDLEAIREQDQICGWDLGAYRLGRVREIDDFLVPILLDASEVGIKLKIRYDRVRPEFYDSRIKPAIKTPDHPAYPSNHSLETHVMALVLNDLSPNASEAFQKADEISRNREVAGVHYPSDTAFGIKAAILFHDQLVKSPRYQVRLNRMKAIFAQTAEHPNQSGQPVENCNKLIAALKF